MRYFGSLPNLILTDVNNEIYTLKNLLIRTEIIPQLAKNPLIFYKYSVQEGDTPEIVADKYYGDSFRYWMVLYGNQNIMDPQWDWPLSANQFTAYLQDKYSAAAGGINNVISYIQGTVHHYEKVITSIDSDSGTTAIKNVQVDYNTYLSISPFTEVKSFPDGTSVTYSISSKEVSIYEYELGINEAKRDIQIINSNYATQLESTYNTLVNS